ncbi:MAG: alanine racemase [Chloroflexi bacterium]|nr:alanine racemase [Chloroflexota bacterium]
MIHERPALDDSAHGALSPDNPGPCWLDIDLDAIRQNVSALRRLVGGRTGVAAVVKAGAYGLGAAPVASAAVAAGATFLCVARLSEASELRVAGLQTPIVNLARTSPEEAELAVAYGVTATVADQESLEGLVRAASKWGVRLPVHLKVDTGLTRYGAQPYELLDLLPRLRKAAAIHVEGIISHFAAADEPDLACAREQLARFEEAVALVGSAGLHPAYRHLANSAGALALPEARLDLVRLGITLSGHYPSESVPRDVRLRPAVLFKARLARVYHLPADTPIGYGHSFVTARPTVAGLVPAGYADGLPRAASGRGSVLVRGRRAPMIGRVSMDQCVVDLTDVPGAAVGDEAVLFGKQDHASIPLEEFAAWGDTISHEALCRIGPRVPRVYRGAPVLTGRLARPE